MFKKYSVQVSLSVLENSPSIIFGSRADWDHNQKVWGQNFKCEEVGRAFGPVFSNVKNTSGTMQKMLTVSWSKFNVSD